MNTLSYILLGLFLVSLLAIAWLAKRLLFWKFKSFELEGRLEFSESKQKETETLSERMKESFQALAHQALEGQTKQFIEIAQQSLSKHTELAKADLDKRQMAIDGVVSPLREVLDKVQKQASEMEKERRRSYTTVEAELKRVIESSQTLSAETRALKNALTKPNTRGQWGEMQLKNCIELAGMSEYADVTVHDATTSEEGQKFIPDMTVKMPGDRIVIVDAKTPLDSFIAALEATTESEKAAHMQKHGMQVKEHVRKLSQKNYGGNVKESADFTVMFLPNESFLYAALDTQSDLIEYALQKKILIATPPTFIGLLKVIRYGWREEKLAKNAKMVWEVGKELHKRLVDFAESYTKVGKSLSSAQKSFDEGFNRLNSRVLTQVRKLEKLGVKGSKTMQDDLGYEFEEGEDPEQLKAPETEL